MGEVYRSFLPQSRFWEFRSVRFTDWGRFRASDQRFQFVFSSRRRPAWGLTLEIGDDEPRAGPLGGIQVLDQRLGKRLKSLQRLIPKFRCRPIESCLSCESMWKEEAMVGMAGLEPATFCTPCRRASQTTLHPEPCCSPDFSDSERSIRR